MSDDRINEIRKILAEVAGSNDNRAPRPADRVAADLALVMDALRLSAVAKATHPGSGMSPDGCLAACQIIDDARDEVESLIARETAIDPAREWFPETAKLADRCAFNRRRPLRGQRLQDVDAREAIEQIARQCNGSVPSPGNE